jgi:hypothetical protein
MGKYTEKIPAEKMGALVQQERHHMTADGVGEYDGDEGSQYLKTVNSSVRI